MSSTDIVASKPKLSTIVPSSRTQRNMSGFHITTSIVLAATLLAGSVLSQPPPAAPAAPAPATPAAPAAPNCFPLTTTQVCTSWKDVSMQASDLFQNATSFDQYLRSTFEGTPTGIQDFQTTHKCPTWNGKGRRYHTSFLCGMFVDISTANGCNAPTNPAVKPLCAGTAQQAVDSVRTIFADPAACPPGETRAMPDTWGQFTRRMSSNQNCVPALPNEWQTCGLASDAEAQTYCNAPGSSKDVCCSAVEAKAKGQSVAVPTGLSPIPTVPNSATNTNSPSATGASVDANSGKSSASYQKLSTPIIIAIVVGGIIFIALIVGIWIWLGRRRARRDMPDGFKHSNQGSANGSFGRYDSSAGMYKNAGHAGGHDGQAMPSMRGPEGHGGHNGMAMMSGAAAAGGLAGAGMAAALASQSRDDDEPMPIAETMEVVYNYVPNLSDEIYLYIGDPVIVKCKFDDGWGYGFNMTTKQEGSFPLACVAPYNSRQNAEPGTYDNMGPQQPQDHQQDHPQQPQQQQPHQNGQYNGGYDYQDPQQPYQPYPADDTKRWDNDRDERMGTLQSIDSSLYGRRDSSLGRFASSNNFNNDSPNPSPLNGGSPLNPNNKNANASGNGDQDGTLQPQQQQRGLAPPSQPQQQPGQGPNGEKIPNNMSIYNLYPTMTSINTAKTFSLQPQQVQQGYVTRPDSNEASFVVSPSTSQPPMKLTVKNADEPSNASDQSVTPVPTGPTYGAGGGGDGGFGYQQPYYSNQGNEPYNLHRAHYGGDTPEGNDIAPHSGSKPRDTTDSQVPYLNTYFEDSNTSGEILGAIDAAASNAAKAAAASNSGIGILGGVNDHVYSPEPSSPATGSSPASTESDHTIGHLAPRQQTPYHSSQGKPGTTNSDYFPAYDSYYHQPSISQDQHQRSPRETTDSALINYAAYAAYVDEDPHKRH